MPRMWPKCGRRSGGVAIVWPLDHPDHDGRDGSSSMHNGPNNRNYLRHHPFRWAVLVRWQESLPYTCGQARSRVIHWKA